MAETTRRRRTQAQQKTAEQKQTGAEEHSLTGNQEAIVPEQLIQKAPDDADELAELLTAQAQMTYHPAGTLDAKSMFEEPTILAERDRNTHRTGLESLSLKGPTKAHPTPIAVVSADGSVYPFSGEDRDRISLFGYGVTYLYDKEDVKKVVAHNQKMLREGNVDRVIQGVAMSPPALPRDNDTAQLQEALTVAFNPSMLNR